MVPDPDGEGLVVVGVRRRPGEREDIAVGNDDAVAAGPGVGAVDQDEVGVAQPGVVPGRLRLVARAGRPGAAATLPS